MQLELCVPRRWVCCESHANGLREPGPLGTSQCAVLGIMGLPAASAAAPAIQSIRRLVQATGIPAAVPATGARSTGAVPETAAGSAVAGPRAGGRAARLFARAGAAPQKECWSDHP